MVMLREVAKFDESLLRVKHSSPSIERVDALDASPWSISELATALLCRDARLDNPATFMELLHDVLCTPRDVSPTAARAMMAYLVQHAVPSLVESLGESLGDTNKAVAHSLTTCWTSLMEPGGTAAAAPPSTQASCGAQMHAIRCIATWSIDALRVYLRTLQQPTSKSTIIPIKGATKQKPATTVPPTAAIVDELDKEVARGAFMSVTSFAMRLDCALALAADRIPSVDVVRQHWRTVIVPRCTARFLAACGDKRVSDVVQGAFEAHAFFARTHSIAPGCPSPPPPPSDAPQPQSLDALALSLEVLRAVEALDVKGLFLHPFWRHTTGNATPTDPVHHYDCTMMMRRGLAYAAQRGEVDRSDARACYRYLCQSMERVVDDCVVIFRPDAVESTLAGRMRQELAREAQLKGLLQR